MQPRRTWRAPLALALTVGAGVALVGMAARSGNRHLPSHSSANTSPISAAAHVAVRETWQSNPTFPGVAMVVRAPGVSWSDAVGLADRAGATPLTPRSPFRIASVTKTFVAAAVLRLAETHRLRLDDPIGRRLGRRSVSLLRAGGYDPRMITVRMLLQHTSGIADFASHPLYQTVVAASPSHRWTRDEQVGFAIRSGRPLSVPGRAFHYSDTGYVLLGEILERTSRMSLAHALRVLLRFTRIGLAHTYLESLENPRGDHLPRAHQYLDDRDTFGFDPSFDLYGGGGLVSTLDDLVRFMRALHGGRILTPASVALMRGSSAPGGRDVGMGLFRLRLGTEVCYGHQGFWGTNVTHCPASGITIATTVNQAAGFETASMNLHQRLYGSAIDLRRVQGAPDSMLPATTTASGRLAGRARP